MKNCDFGTQSPSLYQPPKGWDVADVDAMMENMKDQGPVAGSSSVWEHPLSA